VLSKVLSFLRLIDLQDLYFDITETYSESTVTRIDQNRLSNFEIPFRNKNQENYFYHTRKHPYANDSPIRTCRTRSGM